MVATFALATVSVNAQNAVGQWTIQPKVGMNIANLTDAEADPRIGFAVGAELEYGIADIFGISAGVVYSMQGAKASGDVEGVKADGTLKLDYINVPIMANVYVTKGLAVKLGIQPGFLVNDKAKVTVKGTSVEEDAGAKSFDFSIPVGLSYEYQNFVLDARYNWGLTKVADETSIKNSVFQITLGYKFSL